MGIILLKKEVKDDVLRARYLGMRYKDFIDRRTLLKKQALYLKEKHGKPADQSPSS